MLEINLDNIKEVRVNKYLSYQGYEIVCYNDISYLISLSISNNKIYMYEEIIAWSMADNFNLRLVRFNNNKFGYVDLKTNKVLPYRFDYATNFNIDGLALVCNNGKITWINSNMHYLNCHDFKFKSIEPRDRFKYGFRKTTNFKDSMILVEYETLFNNHMLKEEAYLLYDEENDNFDKLIVNDKMQHILRRK